MWVVRYLPEAEQERDALPPGERVAMINADKKLRALGPLLVPPHSKAVLSAPGIVELRPRAGRSPWRGLYKRIGDEFVIAAIGPDGESNPKGFNKAAQRAVERLEKVEQAERTGYEGYPG